MMIMRSGFWLIVLIISLSVVSCRKESTPEQQVYFNSFESQSDTTGWRGYAFNFDNDVPSHGGSNKLSVSGGCIIPDGQYPIRLRTLIVISQLNFGERTSATEGEYGLQ